ncbi:MAG: FHA domain-containing protein [Candidatus Xenobia bacterium]
MTSYGRLLIRTPKGDTDEVNLTRINNGVGSDPANQIVLRGKGVAVFHCKLIVDEAGCEVVDLGSSRGTVVNGQAVVSRRLRDGDQIAVGDLQLTFSAPPPGSLMPGPELRMPEPAPPPPPPPAPEPAPPMEPAEDLMAAWSDVVATSTPPEAVRRIVRGSRTASTVTLPAAPTMRPPMPPTDPVRARTTQDMEEEAAAARGLLASPLPDSEGDGGEPADFSTPSLLMFDGCDLRRIPLSADAPTVLGTHVSSSIPLPVGLRTFPQHAAVTHEHGQWYVKKLFGQAEIRVNNELQENAVLHDRDVIRLGDVRITFSVQGEPARPQGTCRLLIRMPESGIPVREGEMLGILAAVQADADAVLARLHGAPRIEALDGVLPVSRALFWQGDRARVPDALRALHLEDVQAVPVAQLTPGARRRAELAAAWLTSRSALVVPAGRDALDALEAADLLDGCRGVADEATAVVVASRPWRSLLLCDRLLVLAAGGLVAFYGTPQEALRHFHADDFADLLRRLSHEKTPRAWADAYRESAAAELLKEPLPPVVPPIPSGGTTLRVLRDVERLVRDPARGPLLAAEAVVAALLVALLANGEEAPHRLMLLLGMASAFAVSPRRPAQFGLGLLLAALQAIILTGAVLMRGSDAVAPALIGISSMALSGYLFGVALDRLRRPAGLLLAPLLLLLVGGSPALVHALWLPGLGLLAAASVLLLMRDSSSRIPPVNG